MTDAYRSTRVKAKNIKVGDRFENKLVTQVVKTDKGNVSLKLAGGHWRRRPADEMVPVQRPE